MPWPDGWYGSSYLTRGVYAALAGWYSQEFYRQFQQGLAGGTLFGGMPLMPTPAWSGQPDDEYMYHVDKLNTFLWGRYMLMRVDGVRVAGVFGSTSPTGEGGECGSISQALLCDDPTGTCSPALGTAERMITLPTQLNVGGGPPDPCSLAGEPFSWLVDAVWVLLMDVTAWDSRRTDREHVYVPLAVVDETDSDGSTKPISVLLAECQGLVGLDDWIELGDGLTLPGSGLAPNIAATDDTWGDGI